MSDINRPSKKVLINPNFCSSKVHFNPRFVSTTASRSGSSYEGAYHAQVCQDFKSHRRISNSATSLKNGSSGELVHPQSSDVLTKVHSTAIIYPTTSHEPSFLAQPSAHTLGNTDSAAVQNCSVTGISKYYDNTYSSLPIVYSAFSSTDASALHLMSDHPSISCHSSDQTEVRSTQDVLPQWNYSHNSSTSGQRANDFCGVQSNTGSAADSVCSVQSHNRECSTSQSIHQSSNFNACATGTNSLISKKSDSHSYYVNPNFFQSHLSVNQHVLHSVPSLAELKPEVTSAVLYASSKVTSSSNLDRKELISNMGNLQILTNLEDSHASPNKQSTANCFEVLPNKDQAKIRKVLVNPKFYNPQKLEKTDSLIKDSQLAVNSRDKPINCLKEGSVSPTSISTCLLAQNSVGKTSPLPLNSNSVSKLKNSIAIQSSKKDTFATSEIKNLNNQIASNEQRPSNMSVRIPSNSVGKLSLNKKLTNTLNIGCKVNSLKDNKTDFYQLSRTKLVRRNSSSHSCTTRSTTKLYNLSSKKLDHRNNVSVRSRIPSGSKVVSTFKIRNKLILKSPDMKHMQPVNSLGTHKRTSPPVRKYSIFSARKLVRRLSTDSCTSVRPGQISSGTRYKACLRQKHTLPGNVGNKEAKSDRFVKIGGSMYKTTPTSLERHTVMKKSKSTRESGGTNARTIHSQILSSRRCFVPNGASNYRQNFGLSLSMNKKLGRSFHCYSLGKSTYSQKHVLNSEKSYIGQSAQQMMYARRANFHMNTQPRYSMNFKFRPGCRLSPNMPTNNAMSNSGCRRDHRQILVAHALKAQALQCLIVAAKRRSVMALKRRTVAVGSSCKTMSAVSRAATSEAINSASVARAAGTKPQKLATYCRFYHRFGKCCRGDACPYEHNPDRVAICTRFLRGRCRVEKCLFAHTLDKGRMPVCSHFLKGGLCVRDDCPYLHVNPNRKAPICEDFLHGHCDKREQCKLQHVLECAEYRETGRCPRLQCPLPHPRHRRATKPNLAHLPKDNKRKKRRRSSMTNSDGNRSVLGAVSTLPTKAKVKKVQGNVRYFQRGSTNGEEILFNDAAAQSEQFEEKRRRISRLVESMKSRTKEANVTTATVHRKPVTRTGGATAGKYKLAAESEVVFVQPLCNFSVEDEPLPFIPLSSEPGASCNSTFNAC